MTGKIGKADFTLTIRMKIEIIFLVFVLVLSTINIGSFSAARSSIGKFDNMIETMLIINSINNTSIGITGLLKDYQTSKKGDVEQKINDSIKVIVDDMRYLQKAVNGKALLETLQRVVGNFSRIGRNGYRSHQGKQFGRNYRQSAENGNVEWTG